jgi:phage-related protein
MYKRYYLDFYESLPDSARKKINFVLDLIRSLERIPSKFLKHIEDTDGLYEIRVEVGSNIYRIFCFFDRGNIVILTNGFQKKTQKTPRSEIEKALRIMKEYYDEK